MSLDWKIPPSEATADHGEYAVQNMHGKPSCHYKGNGSEEWVLLGFADSLDEARGIGDRHARTRSGSPAAHEDEK